MSSEAFPFHRAFFEHAGDLFCVIDANGVLQELNPAWEGILGRPVAELRGRCVGETIHPDDQAVLGALFRSGGENFPHKPFQREIRHLGRGGRVRWILWSATPDREACLLYAVGQDVTERVFAEEMQEEKRRKHRLLAENVTDLLSILALDASIKYVSPSWEEMLGLKAAELVGRPPYGTVHPEDLHAFASTFAAVAEGRVRSAVVTHRSRRRDGSSVWFETAFRLVLDEGRPQAAAEVLCVSRDVGARKEADRLLAESQAALVESEARFRAVMNSSLDATLFLQCERDFTGSVVDFVFTDLNENAEEYLLKARGQIVGRRLGELFPWIKHDGLFERAVHAVETGSVLEDELDISVPELDARWLHYQMIPFDNGIAVSARDITDRKRFEEDLRSSQARLSRIIANSDEIIYTLSLDGACTFASPRWTELLGHAVKDVEGRSFVSFVHAQDIPHCMDFLEGALGSDDGPRRGLECRFRTTAGEWRWYSSSVTAVRDDEGQAQYLVGVARDITDRKVLEEELREQRDFLHRVVDLLPVALFCKDARNDWRYTLWNRKSEEIFGIPREDTFGRNDFDFFPRDEALFFREKDEAALASREGIDIPEESVSAKGKGVVLVRTKKAAVPDAQGKPRYLLGISEDITERKSAQKALREQQMKMVAASKMSSLGEMSAGIAHEINNPLTIIQGSADALRLAVERGMPADPARVTAACVRIADTVQRIARIVKALRSFARENEHESFESCRVSSIVSDALDLCGSRFGYHRVQVRVSSISPELRIEARPIQVAQVLLNLLNNSFDAVEGLEERWISIDVEEDPSHVRLVVTDSGPGIPKELREKIMQPFFTTKDIGKGTGLGLSISKGIVETHGGRFWLDTTHGRTRFVVELPKRQQGQGSRRVG